MSHNRFGDEPVPKPYAFVPFPPKTERREVPGHERLELIDYYSGRLTYRMKVLTPLFVGTGTYALGEEVGFPQEQVVRPLYRVNGVPTIPGSSLKGVARSIAEAVSPSCITVTRVKPYKLPKEVDLAHSRRSQCAPTNACPACSIFGRMGQLGKGQLGKARFGDAPLLGGGETRLFHLPPLFAPRAFRDPPVYLDEHGRFKGRKFYYHSRPTEDKRQPPVEVIPPGRIVEGRVDFENLTAAELGLLFFALGVDGTLALKLGGGKPLGLGSLRVVDAEVSVLAADHYTRAETQDTLYRDQPLKELVVQTTDAAMRERLLLREQALALAKILTFTQDRHAPEGSY